MEKIEKVLEEAKEWLNRHLTKCLSVILIGMLLLTYYAMLGQRQWDAYKVGKAYGTEELLLEAQFALKYGDPEGRCESALRILESLGYASIGGKKNIEKAQISFQEARQLNAFYMFNSRCTSIPRRLEEKKFFREAGHMWKTMLEDAQSLKTDLAAYREFLGMTTLAITRTGWSYKKFKSKIRVVILTDLQHCYVEFLLQRGYENPQEAATGLAEALKISEEMFNKDSKTLSHIHLLARALAANGRYQEAAEKIETAKIQAQEDETKIVNLETDLQRFKKGASHRKRRF